MHVGLYGRMNRCIGASCPGAADLHYGLEEVEHSLDVAVHGVVGHLEADAVDSLRGEVVDVCRLHSRDDVLHALAVVDVPCVERDLVQHSVERRQVAARPDQPVDLPALAQAS